MLCGMNDNLATKQEGVMDAKCFTLQNIRIYLLN